MKNDSLHFVSLRAAGRNILRPATKRLLIICTSSSTLQQAQCLGAPLAASLPFQDVDNITVKVVAALTGHLVF